jgi:large subunit ribosomal protein L35
MKTNRGAAKRFSRTGGGRIRHARAYCRHQMTHKSPKRRMRLRTTRATIGSGDAKRVRQMLPNLG